MEPGPIWYRVGVKSVGSEREVVPLSPRAPERVLRELLPSAKEGEIAAILEVANGSARALVSQARGARTGPIDVSNLSLETLRVLAQVALGEEPWGEELRAASRFDWQSPGLHPEERFERALSSPAPEAKVWLVQAPAPENHAHRLRWARVALDDGEAVRCLDALERQNSRTVPEQLLVAEARVSIGENQRAIEILRVLPTSGAQQEVDRLLLLSEAHLQLGKNEEAQAVLQEVSRRLRDVTPSERAAYESAVSGLRFRMGHVADGARSATRISRGASVFDLWRLVSIVGLRGAGKTLSGILEGSSPTRVSGLARRALEGIGRVAAGRYEGLDAFCSSLLGDAESLGNASLYHLAFLLERLVSLGHSMSREEPIWPETIPRPKGGAAVYTEALRVSHRARRGESVSRDDVPRASTSDGPVIQIVCRYVESFVALLNGDERGALSILNELLAEARRRRFGLINGELLLIQGYAYTSLGDSERLRRSLADLHAIAEAWNSSRYLALADLMMMASEGPDIVRLMELSLADGASPTVARVARALLGSPSADMDALDHLLAESIPRDWDVTVQGGENSSSWAFAPRSRTLFLANSSRRASPLATRILETLFAQKEVDLETLATSAWGLLEYHPLRDSKRVHVAIRRLRTLVEEDASNPTRILTTETGYRLSRTDAPAWIVPVAEAR